jgi:GNAT superfamily N-acetyltransferase
MRVRICEANLGDLDRLAPLVQGFWQEHNEMLGGAGDYYTLEEALEEVKKHLSREDSAYFVAIDSSGRFVGFRRWKLHDDFYFTRELYVIPEMRRKGVARALIRHFERWALKKGQEIARISCTPHNIAMIRLARAEGYDILNTIEL